MLKSRIQPASLFKVFPRARDTSFPSSYYCKIMKGHSVMKQTAITQMTTELHVLMAQVFNLDPTTGNIPQATVSQPAMSPQIQAAMQQAYPNTPQ